VDPSATKEGYGFSRSLISPWGSQGNYWRVHAASSNTCNTPNNEASTISRAQTTTASDGLAAYNGNSVSLPQRQGVVMAQMTRTIPIDFANHSDYTRLKHRVRELSLEQTSVPTMIRVRHAARKRLQIERRGGLRWNKAWKGRSRSWSNNDNWRTTIGFVQRRERAAQARGPTRSDEMEQSLKMVVHQILMMVVFNKRSSDVAAWWGLLISPESDCRCPMVHPMANFLLALRRGHEGYGATESCQPTWRRSSVYGWQSAYRNEYVSERS
jgi:hypothetical protein